MSNEELFTCSFPYCEECNSEVVPKDFHDRCMELEIKANHQLARELKAAIKVLQRFSYCNENKCRWCKFAKYSESDKRWIPCAHPRSLFPYYQHCTRFEYEYRAETNEKE